MFLKMFTSSLIFLHYTSAHCVTAYCEYTVKRSFWSFETIQFAVHSESEKLSHFGYSIHGELNILQLLYVEGFAYTQAPFPILESLRF